MVKCLNFGKVHNIKLSGYCLEWYIKYKFENRQKQKKG